MKTFIYTTAMGNEIEMVEIDNGNGVATQMTKAHYDELEAAKQNGTIS